MTDHIDKITKARSLAELSAIATDVRAVMAVEGASASEREQIEAAIRERAQRLAFLIGA